MPDKILSAILVEDQEITRLGIRKMLERTQEVEILAEAKSGTEAVQLATELNPCLIFMDVGLPDMDGIEATRIIKQTLASKVIMLTSRDGEEDIVAGLSAGADAYCLKDISASQLVCAIHSVVEGAVWLDPEIGRTLLKAMAKKNMGQSQQNNLAGKTSQQNAGGPGSFKTSHNPFQLSEREYEVLCLLVDGLSNQEMANRLYLSAETVKTHMRHLMEKLRVSDRTQAAVKAVRQGLVPSSDG
jgi:DNA-binding NarL/FixJ family response regulator